MSAVPATGPRRHRAAVRAPLATVVAGRTTIVVTDAVAASGIEPAQHGSDARLRRRRCRGTRTARRALLAGAKYSMPSQCTPSGRSLDVVQIGRADQWTKRSACRDANSARAAACCSGSPAARIEHQREPAHHAAAEHVAKLAERWAWAIAPRSSRAWPAAARWLASKNARRFESGS